MKKVLSLILGLVGLLSAPAAFAQSSTNTPYSQPMYYAVDYGQWAIRSQTANTYLFSPQGLCTTTAAGTQFFEFSTNAPVYIMDVTPANSEIVTPSTVTNAATQCGFSASPTNNHFSFQVKSGTAGLQESLNALSNVNVAHPALVILDRNWWITANSLPGKTGGGIINAATGSFGVVLEDITTAPATFYTWSGSQYVVSDSAFSFFNQDITSTTVLAPPTALTTATSTNGMITTATTGGTIPATSTYRLAITYVDPSGGETLISTDTASTSTIASGATATNTISVSTPAVLAGAVGYRVYMSAAGGAAGSEILYTPTCATTQLQSILPSVCAIGSNAVITAIVTGTATVPAISSAYPRAGGTSQAYSPFPAVGTVNAAATATLGIINFPAGYFNELSRGLSFCGNGYATTNSTPGTLTVANVFSSVAGVTSITPWTVVSGTTTASATVPFNFCETITTAATGVTGTLEVHGCVNYGLAGTAPATPACDIIIAVSSTVDLTKANQWALTIKPTTTALTAAQLRQLTITPFN